MDSKLDYCNYLHYSLPSLKKSAFNRFTTLIHAVLVKLLNRLMPVLSHVVFRGSK